MSPVQGKIIVGVDVSKLWLDVAFGAAGRVELRRLANEPDAIAAFLAALQPHGIGLVAFEPTGGYERDLADALRRLGIVHARIHPGRLVAFRRQRGVKAKTDARDARLIQAFAAAELPAGSRPCAQADDMLRELVTRREQVMAALQAERCRLEHVRSPLVRGQVERALRALELDRGEIEAALSEHVAGDDGLRARASLMRSLKGVGPVTTSTLLARLPQLGLASGKQIASLVGLAPRDRQSGKRTHHAATGHGDQAVRRSLFNAARSAIVHNPVLRAFYTRLVTVNRRPKAVALTAVMRKLLVILNAILHSQQPWRHAQNP